MRMLRALRSCSWPDSLKQSLLQEACRDLSFRVCATVSRAAAEWQHHISAAQLWQGLDRWRQLALLLQELSDCPSGNIAGAVCRVPIVACNMKSAQDACLLAVMMDAAVTQPRVQCCP